MRRMFKFLSIQLATMARPQIGSPWVNATMLEHHRTDGWLFPTQGVDGGFPPSDQMSHCLMNRLGNPHLGHFSCSMKSSELGRVATIGLDPVAGALRNQRWRNHRAIVAVLSQLAIEALAHRPGLKAKAKG